MLDVDRIYQDLRSDLQQMEEERIKTVHNIYPFKIFFQICMVVVLAETVHMVFFDGFTGMMLGFTVSCFLSGILVYGIKHAYESNKYKKLFQKEIVAQIIPKLGPEFTYQPDGKIPVEELKCTLLFSYFNQYHCEDLVIGKIGNKMVRYAEIKLVKKTTRSSSSKGSSKETTYTTIFEGMFLIIELKSSFPSPFWILPKKSRFSFVKDMEGGFITVDHAKFVETFVIYGQDPDSSKKLLITPIMDSLMSLNSNLRAKKIIAKDIHFSFMDNKISIALPTTRKFMEPTLRQPINTKAFIEEQLVFLNGIHEVAELVG